MILRKSILNKWKLLRNHGDVKKIVDQYGENNSCVYKNAVVTALNEGECSEDLFKILNAFYTERENLLKSA